MFICEIICVGTELLLGEILNTDAQYLCRELAAMGIAVQRVITVGDNPQRLSEDFLTAWGRSDLVLLTGGLGPTKDDLTKETVCAALGIPLVEDERTARKIEDYFDRRGIPFVESNRKQALVPEGCTVLYNANGTAPGCFIQKDGKAAALLPGPPRELRPMFAESLAPLLKPWSDGVIVSHHLRTIGIGESRMAELAGALLDMENPTVAPYAKDGEAYLRISSAAESREAADALCLPVLGKLRSLLGKYVYSVDKPLEEVVLGLLRERGKTVAFAESCTGGGIAALLTSLPGASEVFRYGFVTYANEAKAKLLGVSPETLSKYGAVSGQCAEEMARGALKSSGASIAAAVTGIAGPGGGTPEKPVGMVWIALAGPEGTMAECHHFAHDRDGNRRRAVHAALDLLRRTMDNA